MKASDIKVGVIGYGGAFNMGRAHLQEAARAGMVPAAVTDLDPSRLEVARKDFPGIETYPTLRELLRKSEANLIVVITPHNSHARLAIQCLKAGRHVVCEKPFAVTTKECDAMIETAKARGLLVTAYHNRHWDGCILRAVEQAKLGAIGEIVRVEAHMGGWGKPGDWWRSSKSISGGILYDWGVHLLEYTLQLVNSDVTEVSGFARKGLWAPHCAWKDDTNEDEAFATIRFKSGAWATLKISSIDSKPRDGWLHIQGTRGSYTFDGGTWHTVAAVDNATVTTKGRNPESQSWRFYQNIADHLTKGTKLVITPEWARRPIHLIDMACASAERMSAMKVKYA